MTITKRVLALLLFFAAANTHAQETDPLKALSDEFNDTALLKRWHIQDREEGYPSRFNRISVEQDGLLHLEPFACGWFENYQGGFIYKDINGDFDARIKIQVTGIRSELPASTWSLAGLMLRRPPVTSLFNYEENRENWFFLTTGIANNLTVPVFETKSTINSGSQLKLRPAKTGWMEMRLLRLGIAFFFLSRYEGETEWILQQRFYLPGTPPVLQLGINAYTDGITAWQLAGSRDARVVNSMNTAGIGKPDLRVLVDYFRINRPALNQKKLKRLMPEKYELLYYTAENLLTDYGTSNEQVLEILGP